MSIIKSEFRIAEITVENFGKILYNNAISKIIIYESFAN